MSGICATLRLDSTAAEAEAIAPVLAELAARGPDRSGIVFDGPAALGHALLATTPEALVEPMPLRHAESGCMIAADVRLDNRAELVAALGIAAAEQVIGDGALILAAYRKWGTDCPEHLLGDFAFVIWDARAQRLFAARDKVGMRQLIWHFADRRLFACATDATALLAHPEVPHRLNAARIADFLEQMEASDSTSTFFEGLYRLPPAHALAVENGAMRVWRYWQLTAPPILMLRRDEDYAEAFRDVFTEAVRARLRSPDPVGAMLSGGIDSGSVVAVAAATLRDAGQPPLATFSAIDRDPDCRESAAVHDAVGFIPHLSPRLVSTADAGSFRDAVAQLTRAGSDPFDGHMAMIRALYVTAQSSGIKVMLDGVSGDTTLPTGDMVAYHLARGRIGAAWAEAKAQERFWSGQLDASTAMRAALKRTLLPGWLRELRRRRWETVQAEQAARDSPVHPDLARRLDMPARRRANAGHLHVGTHCDQPSQALRMLHPYVIVGRERYDRVAAACGIEPRDPYLDVRLLEFCLTLPVEQIHGNGWPKLVLRRAMSRMLPESVCWKTGRDHVGWRFAEIIDETLGDESTEKNCRFPLSRFIRPDMYSNIVGSKSELKYLSNWLNIYNPS
jgi:asparagine synthase (glutamine-hydrolysing)